jgi:hypothetical protein
VKEEAKGSPEQEMPEGQTVSSRTETKPAKSATAPAGPKYRPAKRTLPDGRLGAEVFGCLKTISQEAA